MDAANPTFPKVLIIGLPFDKKTGGGITMTNLFKGWPKDRLALASNVNLQDNPDYSVCDQYYQLSYNDKLHPFPLSLVLPKVKTGPVGNTSTGNDESQSQKIVSGKYKSVYKLISAALHFLGIYNAIYKLKITPAFREWLIDYNPDIIYSQLSTLELIRFVSDVNAVTGKPVVVHMMDDWPVTINKPGLLRFYWRKVIDREFRQLLDKSSVLMSICDAMSEEYKIRYKKEFVPFHNTIETANWVPNSKTDWSVKNKFTILYAGRVGIGVKTSITEIAGALNDPRLANMDIVFELQVPDVSALKKHINFNDRIKWVKPIQYAELPVKFSSADMLVLPHDFDRWSVNFLRYSFSTKVTEYMISGTPVLVYADKQTALAKYAISEKWAYTVSEHNKDLLIKAISDMYSDMSLRKELGERAKRLAQQKEDSVIVRDNFRKAFILH